MKSVLFQTPCRYVVHATYFYERTPAQSVSKEDEKDEMRFIHPRWMRVFVNSQGMYITIASYKYEQS